MAEEAKALEQQKKEQEAMAQHLRAKQHQVRRDRLNCDVMVSNETQKIKVLHQQFADLLQTQQARSGNASAATVEVSEKLSSIKALLELLLNDREAMKGSNKSLDSSSSGESKRKEARDKDNKTADQSEAQAQPSALPQPSNGQEQPAAAADPSGAPRDR